MLASTMPSTETSSVFSTPTSSIRAYVEEAP